LKAIAEMEAWVKKGMKGPHPWKGKFVSYALGANHKLKSLEAAAVLLPKCTELKTMRCQVFWGIDLSEQSKVSQVFVVVLHTFLLAHDQPGPENINHSSKIPSHVFLNHVLHLQLATTHNDMKKKTTTQLNVWTMAVRKFLVRLCIISIIAWLLFISHVTCVHSCCTFASILIFICRKPACPR
jgi:hypothetical protein